GALATAPCSRRSGFLDEPDQRQQNDGANRCHDDVAQQAARRDAHQAKQVAAQYRTDNANNNVADGAEAAALDDQAGEPANQCADGEKDDQADDVHVTSCVKASFTSRERTCSGCCGRHDQRKSSHAYLSFSAPTMMQTAPPTMPIQASIGVSPLSARPSLAPAESYTS